MSHVWRLQKENINELNWKTPFWSQGSFQGGFSKNKLISFLTDFLEFKVTKLLIEIVNFGIWCNIEHFLKLPLQSSRMFLIDDNLANVRSNIENLVDSLNGASWNLYEQVVLFISYLVAKICDFSWKYFKRCCSILKINLRVFTLRSHSATTTSFSIAWKTYCRSLRRKRWTK